jgi:cell division protein FtsL
MTRLNFVLLAAVLLCALATVTSTHRARLLFADLENEQSRQKQIEVEWRQLQLEQSTWAKHALVEGIAERQLGMHAPDPRRLVFVSPTTSAPVAIAGTPAPANSAPVSGGAPAVAR